jgi:regulator of protease activity HflC (stomatin/prohibitin superfamily)
MVRISLRQEALEVPSQDIITRDNVTLKVNAVIFPRVVDPNHAVVEVSNYLHQTSQFAQTTLRSVLGEVELDELLPAGKRPTYETDQTANRLTHANR